MALFTVRLRGLRRLLQATALVQLTKGTLAIRDRWISARRPFRRSWEALGERVRDGTCWAHPASLSCLFWGASAWLTLTRLGAKGLSRCRDPRARHDSSDLGQSGRANVSRRNGARRTGPRYVARFADANVLQPSASTPGTSRR